MQCRYGDLDLATAGDGRFKINWHAVQCDVGDSAIVYGLAASNPYYVNLKVANTRVPVAGVSIRAQGQGSFAVMQATSDNSWLLFSGVPLTFPADVVLTSALGDVVMDTIATTNLQGPPVQGSAQFPHHPELECVPSAPNTTAPPACGQFCSSPYASRPQPVAPGAEVQSDTPLTNRTTPAVTNCTASLPVNEQCGGTGGACVDCVDAPWPGACCTSGHTCDRKNDAFWACDLDPFVRQPNTLEPYMQCGGTGSGCANTTGAATVTGLPRCVDGPWPEYRCSPDFLCARFAEEYWRCQDVPAKFPRFSAAQAQDAGTGSGVGRASTCLA